MANQNATQDDNHAPALIAHTGTAGTAETSKIVSKKGGISISGTYGLYGQDAATEAITIIDYAHHEIHNGSHFFLTGFGTAGNGTNIDFTVITPNTTTWPHVIWKVETTLQTEAYVYEDSSLGTGGTAFTPINNNRNSSGTSVLTIKLGQEIGTLGNLISAQSWGGTATGGRSFGGDFNRENELVFKQNGTYTVRLTSRANNNIISYYAHWYELADKN